MIIGEQVTAARNHLGGSGGRSGRRCNSSEFSIAKFEYGVLNLQPAKLTAIQQAFEEAGAKFTNDALPAARLKAPPARSLCCE